MRAAVILMLFGGLVPAAPAPPPKVRPPFEGEWIVSRRGEKPAVVLFLSKEECRVTVSGAPFDTAVWSVHANRLVIFAKHYDDDGCRKTWMEDIPLRPGRCESADSRVVLEQQKAR